MIFSSLNHGLGPVESGYIEQHVLEFLGRAGIAVNNTTGLLTHPSADDRGAVHAVWVLQCFACLAFLVTVSVRLVRARRHRRPRVQDQLLRRPLQRLGYATGLFLVCLQTASCGLPSNACQ